MAIAKVFIGLIVVLAIARPGAALVLDGQQGLTSVAAFGGGGVYRTTDGWKSSTKVLNTNINVISFPTSTTGFAAGDGIYKSTDAGVSWTPILSIPNATAVAFAACDETHAIASLFVNDGTTTGGTVTATTEDGSTWTVSKLSNSSGISFMRNADTSPNTVFAVQFFAQVKSLAVPIASVLSTQDCGASWTSVWNFSRPIPNNFNLQNAFDMALYFRTPEEGMALGWFGEAEIPNTAHAQSCGVGEDISRAPGLFSANPSLVSMANKTTGTGYILTSSNGGEVFAPSRPPVQPVTLNTTCGTTLYGAAFVGNDTTFVCGGSFFFLKPAGYILRSEDGGQTWENVFTTTFTDIHRMSFGPSGMHGCAVGMFSSNVAADRYAAVACTTNGGNSWTMQDTKFAFPSDPLLWEDVDIVVLS